MSKQRMPRGKVGLWRTVLEAVDHDRARPVECGRLSEVARACLPIVPAACRAKTIDSALRSAAKKWAPESFTFDEADAPKRLPNVPVAAVVLHCAAERCENPAGWKDQSTNTRHSALPVPSGERGERISVHTLQLQHARQRVRSFEVVPMATKGPGRRR